MNRFLHDLKDLGQFCRDASSDKVIFDASVETEGIMISVTLCFADVQSAHVIVPWTELNHYEGNLLFSKANQLLDKTNELLKSFNHP